MRSIRFRSTCAGLDLVAVGARLRQSTLLNAIAGFLP